MWINVNESLPPDDHYVLWVCESGHVFHACVDHDMDAPYLEQFLMGSEDTGQITHWMEVPPLPLSEDAQVKEASNDSTRPR